MCIFQIGNILSIDRAKLEHACNQLSIIPFDDDEYEFLKQYFQVVNKVAIALKSLEGNQHTFGRYLPTLFGLRNLLEKYADRASTETPECLELAIALKNGFEKRFAELMDVFDIEEKSAPLYIAMISNPRFKLNFMGTRTICPSVLAQLKEILINAAIEIKRANQIKPGQNNNANAANIDQQNGKRSTQSIFISILLVAFLARISCFCYATRIQTKDRFK